MSFLALHSLARLQDVVGRRAGSEDLSEEQGRDVGKAIRNLCAMALYAELQQPVVPKELILQICKWCSHKTQSQFLCFLRHGMRRMADLGLELAPLKVILHWNEKNGTWWEEDLRTSVKAAVESGKSLDTLRLRLRNGNLLPLTNLESEWITWRDFPASLLNITQTFEDCAEDPVRDLEEALPWDLQGWVRQFRAQQEKLLEQRLWLLRSYLMPGAHSNVRSLVQQPAAMHALNDLIVRMLVSLRPKAMLSHSWAPIRVWLRDRFHVPPELLTRIFTVAAKIVDQLVRHLDSSLPSQRAHGWTVHDVPLSNFDVSGRGKSQHPTFVPTASQMKPPNGQMPDVSQYKVPTASQMKPPNGQMPDVSQYKVPMKPPNGQMPDVSQDKVPMKPPNGQMPDVSQDKEKPKSRPIVRQRWGDLVPVDTEAEPDNGIDLKRYDEALRGSHTIPTAQPSRIAVRGHTSQQQLT